MKPAITRSILHKDIKWFRTGECEVTSILPCSKKTYMFIKLKDGFVYADSYKMQGDSMVLYAMSSFESSLATSIFNEVHETAPRVFREDLLRSKGRVE